MRQDEVLSLLNEAAEIGAELRKQPTPARFAEILARLDKIQESLLSAIFDERGSRFNRIVRMVADSIIKDTLLGDPSYFPQLFPFFATICGERAEGQPMAHVDWNMTKAD